MQAGTTNERRAAWREGARDFLGPAVGVGAWGLVTGVAMAQSSLSLAQSLGLTLLAFAGSAQLAVLPLLAAGAPVWVTVLTALVVNLRFVIYSVGLARPLAHLPPGRRAWLGYLVGDLPFVMFQARIAARPEWPERDAYLAGLLLTNWVAWQITSLAGLALAARIPRAWGLELAGTLALLALLVPMAARSRAALVGVGVTAVVSLASYRFPLRLGVLISIGAGVAAALVADALGWRLRRPGAA